MKESILSGIFAFAFLATVCVDNYLRHILIIAIIGICLFPSCIEINKRERKEDSRICANIDIGKLHTFDIELFTDLVRFIPLETKNESLIVSISKLYIEDDFIIVFDRQNKNILLFNKNGSFIRKIGEKGNGPLQYLEFNDIYYNSNTKEIYAFERYQNKMYVYSLNGDITQVIDSNFSFNSFIKTEKGFWIYSCFKNNNPNNFNLIYSDEKLQKIKNGFFPQKNFVNIANETCFSEDQEDNKYFFYPSSNIIYRLENDKVEPFIEVNFEGRNLPYEKILDVETISDYDKIINSKNYIGFIQNLHVSKNTYIFNCSESNLNKPIKSFQIYFNTKKQEVSVYDSYRNVDGSPSLNNLLGVTDSNEFVFAINPGNLVEYEIDEIKKTLPSISYDSNQILAFYNIKNDIE